jgi:isopentenyl-diphosphate delta-isomerase
VLIGEYDGPVHPNEDEVGDYCYKSMDDLRSSLSAHPQLYTAWFQIAFPMLEAYLEKNKLMAYAAT